MATGCAWTWITVPALRMKINRTKMPMESVTRATSARATATTMPMETESVEISILAPKIPTPRAIPTGWMSGPGSAELAVRVRRRGAMA